MEKNEKDHILRNITRLINCTKDENAWFTQLLRFGFVSTSTWQKIKKEQHDTNSYIRELYMECMRTNNYGELVTSLRECDNDNAADILEEIQSPTSSTGVSTSAPPAPAVQTPSADDFQILEGHLVKIKKVLENVDGLDDEWEEVLLNLKLSVKSKREINKLGNINFGNRVLKTLTFWRSEKAKEATFSKLVAAIESCNNLGADELKEKKAEIQNSA